MNSAVEMMVLGHVVAPYYNDDWLLVLVSNLYEIFCTYGGTKLNYKYLESYGCYSYEIEGLCVES